MKNYILYLCVFLSAINYAQFRKDYRLISEGNLPKVALDETPASNSINDILIVGDTIWLGTSRGLSRSTDNGLSWKNFYLSAEFGSESISALVYDNKTSTIWAATAHSTEVSGSNLPEGSGVRYSADNGATWKTIEQPLDDNTDTVEIYGSNILNALPVTTKIQNIIYDLAVTNRTLWAATFAGGLRKIRIDQLLANNNPKWDRVVLPPDNRASIKPSDSLNFCLSPVSGKFCSDNNLNYRLFSVASVGDTMILAGSANGINISSDAKVADTSNDLSWTKFNHQNQADGISGNFVVALGYNPNNRSIWGATWKAEDLNEFSGVSFSMDLGQTWRTALRDEKVHNFTFYSNKTIGPSDNGAFRSYDNGYSWVLPGSITDVNTKLSLQTRVFYSGAFSLSGSNLWLGTSDGLVRNEGVSDFWSSNWKIYFASQRLSGSGDSYAYSNPFNPKTETCRIVYSIPNGSGNVTIRIFSFGMNYIRTVVQSVERGSGIHNVSSGNDGAPAGIIDEWDGRDDSGNIVPNGVYFYRIDIDDNDPIFGKIMVIR